MKKVKKLSAFVLALSMVFCLAVTSASAAEPNYDDEIVVLDAIPTVTCPMGLGTSNKWTMVVGSTYHYWKIFVSNRSSSQTKVWVTDPNGNIVEGKGANGETITMLILKPNTSAWYYTDKPQVVGEHTIHASSGGSADLDGTLWYKLATDVNDVNTQG